jgi:hypothetical protein
MAKITWQRLSFHRDSTAFLAGAYLVALVYAVNTGKWWWSALCGTVLYIVLTSWRNWRRSDMEVLMPLAGLPEDTFVAFGTANDPDPGNFRRRLSLETFVAALLIVGVVILAR